MEGAGEVDETRDLLRRLRRPTAAIDVRIARQHRDGPAVEPRQTGNGRAAEFAADLEEAVAINQGAYDLAHVVDLAAVARHRLDQPFLAPRRIIRRRPARRQLMDGGWQKGEKAPGTVECLGFARDHIVDRAGAGVDLAAAELLLGEILPDARHHR